MTACVDALGLRSIAVSLVLHAAVVLGVCVQARSGIPEPLERPQTIAWSGATFEVGELVRAGAAQPPQHQPEPLGMPRRIPRPEPKPELETHAAPSPQERNTRRTAAPVSASPAAARAPGNPEALATSAASSRAMSTGAFGAAGLPPGVRSLPGAFSRAIPPATRADAAWQTLPPGPVGAVQVVIEVDDSGRITSAEPDAERHRAEPVPAHLKRLIQRTVLLLGGGAFALSSRAGAGTEKLLIEVALSTRAPSEDSEPDHMTSQGHVPPTPSRPGRAYFTLGSGRHFEAKVTILR